ncbi:phosphatase PAP2 family protein [Variovorax sp.]|uniref:phosphatase PAP2 family protein n=1 Tax=Variovorax sp. TaxID=1871043 RepID=UPI002D596AF5|nr:phosphatase PAP2 family protein [Variovorax sp.]HYP81872.1 phosphatase PAP2 family protein [Variovorax sp.]
MSLRDAIWQTILAVPFGFWHGLTWLGDSGLLVPAAFFIGLWLLVSRRTWHTAFLWLVLFGSASALVLLTKLAFLGWGIGSARFNFTGISGHTMLSASVWPVALWLAAARAGHRWRVTMATVGWLLAWAIGLSRLALLAHSVSEVASGLLLGTATSAAFLAAQRRLPHPAPRASLVLLTLLLPLTLFPPGHAAPTQGLLERIATRVAGIERPFTRDDLACRSVPARGAVSPSDTPAGRTCDLSTPAARAAKLPSIIRPHPMTPVEVPGETS